MTRPTHTPASSNSVALVVIAAAGLWIAPAAHACATPYFVGRQAQPVIKAIVSIAPLKGIVEAILPAGSTVETLIPPGVSEHGYEIPPTKLAALNRADLVVIVGMGLEPQVEKFLKANARASRQVVEFAETVGIDDHDEHEGHDHDGHDHADHKHEDAKKDAKDDKKDDHANCDHGHGAHDPHLWLAPQLVIQLVPAIVESAKKSLGSGPGAAAAGAEVDRKAAALIQRLSMLDQTYETSIKNAKRKKVVVAHDAYGHLAKRYGFETIAIAGLAAGEPSPGSIAQAIKAVKDEGLPCVFIEPQLSPQAAKLIAEKTGVKTMTLDPLGDGDYFKVMNANLDALLFALGGTRIETTAIEKPAPAPVPNTPGPGTAK